MKKCKNLAVGVLLCAIVLSLCACGISREEAVGTWSGTYEYNGNRFSVAIVLDENRTYAKAVYKNQSLSSSETGTYEIDGGDVVLHKYGDASMVIYEYKNGALVNNDHEFRKVG